MGKAPVNGIVLSGGGARGAYEVGVVAGIGVACRGHFVSGHPTLLRFEAGLR